MKIKLIKTIMMLILFLSFTFAASAETIQLKSGKKFEGKIIERTDKNIKVEVDGLPVIFVPGEIASIDGAAITASASVDAQAVKNIPQTTQNDVYINEEFGFEIKGPKGWSKYENDPRGKFMALFNKSSSMEELYPSLSITIDSIPDDKTLEDFAHAIIPTYQELMGMQLIEEPTAIKSNDAQGLEFSLESPVGSNGFATKMQQVIFRKGNTIVSVMYMHKAEEFDKELGVVREAVQSFKMREGLSDLPLIIEKIKPVFVPLAHEESKKLKDEITRTMSAVKSFQCIYMKKEMSSKEPYYYATAKIVSPEEFEVCRWFTQGNARPADTWRIVGKKVYSNTADMWMDFSEMKDKQGNPVPVSTEWTAFYQTVSLAEPVEALEKADAIEIDQSQPGYIIMRLKTTRKEKTKEAEREKPTDLILWIDKDGQTIKIVQSYFFSQAKDKEGKMVEEDRFYGNFNYPFVLGSPKKFFGDNQ